MAEGQVSAERRPGVEQIAKALRSAHPTWSDTRVATEAKTLWHKHVEPLNQKARRRRQSCA